MNLNQSREGGLIRDYINFAGHLQGDLINKTSYIFSYSKTGNLAERRDFSFDFQMRMILIRI
jgi:hypothetical protein